MWLLASVMLGHEGSRRLSPPKNENRTSYPNNVVSKSILAARRSAEHAEEPPRRRGPMHPCKHYPCPGPGAGSAHAMCPCSEVRASGVLTRGSFRYHPHPSSTFSSLSRERSGGRNGGVAYCEFEDRATTRWHWARAQTTVSRYHEWSWNWGERCCYLQQEHVERATHTR